jgi:hypothetical protein
VEYGEQQVLEVYGVDMLLSRLEYGESQDVVALVIEQQVGYDKLSACVLLSYFLFQGFLYVVGIRGELLEDGGQIARLVAEHTQQQVFGTYGCALQSLSFFLAECQYVGYSFGKFVHMCCSFVKK